MDLAAKYTSVVKAALKEASMGEPFDFHVSGPAMWDFRNDQGEVVARDPGWFVIVSIRNSNPGEPDLGRGLPIPSITPPAEMFKAAAVALMEKLRQDRDQKQGSELDQARAAFRAQMQKAGK